MLKISGKIFSILILLILVLPAQDFQITTYTLSDGIPGQRVWSILQSADGRLYFRIASKNYYYDGLEFKEFIGPKYIVLKKDNIGNIWGIPRLIYGDFYRLVGDKWRYHCSPITDSLEIDNIEETKLHFQDNYYNYFKYNLKLYDIYTENGNTKFAFSNLSSVWFSEDNNTVRIDLPSKFKKPRIYNLKLTENGLYIASNLGLFIFKNEQLHKINLGSKKNNIEDIYAIDIVKDENAESDIIWLLGEGWLGYLKDKELIKFASTHLITIPNSHSIDKYFIKVIDNEIFWGSNQAVFFSKRDEVNIVSLREDSGLTGEGAVDIMEDREKNIWIVNHRGINKLKRIEANCFYKVNGLLEDEVTVIRQLPDSTILFAHNAGFSFYRNGKWEYKKLEYSETQPLNSTRIFDVWIDAEYIWFVSKFLGLGRMDLSGNIKWFKPSDNRAYYCLYKNGSNILVGTSKGVLIKEGKNELLKPVEMIGEPIVKQIIKDNDGSLLFVTQNKGIFRYDGVQSSSVLTGIEKLYCIFTDNKNSLLGSELGLFILDEKNEIADKNPFKISDEVYSINMDGKENIWVGSNNGLYIITESKVINFKVKNGLPDNETNRNAFLEDFEGNIWVGTAGGAAKFTGVPKMDNSIKPLIDIIGVSDFQDNLISKESVVFLESDQNNFKIEYRGLTFIDEKKSEFEVTFTNLANNSFNRLITTQHNFNLTNLSPGEYQFSVRVKNLNDIWSDPKSIKISVAFPFYRQIWFYIVVILLSVTIGYFILNYFLQKNYSKKLEDKVEERTRSLNISNEKYEIISRTIDDVIWSFDKNLKLNYVSPAVKVVHGFDIETLFQLDGEKGILDRVDELYGLGDTKTFKTQKLTKEIKIDDRFIEVATSPILNDGNFEGIIGITRDVTERKLGEKERTTAIVQNVEKERTRIARDLHDHIGQIIAAIKLRLDMLGLSCNKNEIECPDEINVNIENMNQQIGIIRKEIRHIIENLNPMQNNRISFYDACSELCDSTSSKTNINIEFSSKIKELGISEESQLMLFRIIQESINNSVKHSSAKNIELKIHKKNSSLEILVQDDGKGFDSRVKAARKNYGLINMKQRAELLGAELEIKSEIGIGTSVKINLDNT